MKKAEYEQFSDRNEKEDTRQSQLSQLPSPNIGRRRTARNSVRLKKGESGSSKNKRHLTNEGLCQTRMGYARGKNDIAGIVMLAILGSLCEISDKDREDEKKTRR